VPLRPKLLHNTTIDADEIVRAPTRFPDFSGPPISYALRVLRPPSCFWTFSPLDCMKRGPQSVSQQFGPRSEHDHLRKAPGWGGGQGLPFDSALIILTRFSSLFLLHPFKTLLFFFVPSAPSIRPLSWCPLFSPVRHGRMFWSVHNVLFFCPSPISFSFSHFLPPLFLFLVILFLQLLGHSVHVASPNHSSPFRSRPAATSASVKAR